MSKDRHSGAPLIFITTHAVKAGRLADLQALNAEFVDFVARHEPEILGLHPYLSEDGRRLTIIQVHPDAHSLQHHLHVAGDRIHAAFELVTNERVDVFGAPDQAATALLDQLRTAGIPVAVSPAPISGLARYL